MIEKLKKKDIQEAEKVYNKGLLMEIPPGHPSKEAVLKELKENYIFIHKENNKIKGLISFRILSNNKIRIDFICSIILRKGIGKKLMKKLADFSIRKKIKLIITAESSKDKRARNFYKNCGFKKYGECNSNNLKLYRIKTKPEIIKKNIK